MQIVMNAFIKSILNFLKKPSIIIILAILVGGILWYVFPREEESLFEFVVAKHGDLVQEVNVIGRVKPVESVDLAFLQSGRISFVGANVGTRVSMGEVLVKIENGDVAAQLSQAEAKAKVAQVKLDELKRGTRPEKISVQKVEVANAEVLLFGTKQDLVNKIDDAFTKSDDAVRNKVGQFISNPRSQNPQINFVVPDSSLENEIEGGFVLVEALLVNWSASLTLLSSESDLITFSSEANNNLREIKSFLEPVSLAVNSLKASSDITQTTIDGYKDDVSVARTNVNTAISNLGTALEKMREKEVALALEKEELVLMEAGSTPLEIAAQIAKIEEEEANISRFRAELAKTIIRSPLSGTVTKQDAKEGEIVAANTIIVSLSSLSKFDIEANIPEADITKVSVGDETVFTLDAFGEDVVFRAIVSKIDPAETIVEGVSTYKVTLHFIDDENLAKSGMTADIAILTAKKEGVIAVPIRAIQGRGDNRYVRILEATGEVVEQEVVVGLRGSSGDIEIVSGVEVGDRVIIFEGE